MMVAVNRFVPSVVARASYRLSARLAMAAIVISCGTGISLDPTRSLGEGARFDGGDVTAMDVEDADAGDELDASPPPADGDTYDGRLDIVEAGERGADILSDVALDLDASLDTVDAGADSPDGDDGAANDAGDGAADAYAADASDGCTVACGWPDADYYVDARAPADGDGSKLKPFKTITAAIAAYQSVLGQPRKAYVAAGTYDRALGEKFPLVLRGLSVQGAGRDQTFVVGTGTLVHSAEGGPLHEQYLVTMLAGDGSLETVISRLSIRPESPIPVSNYYGVFCDRGSAAGEVAAPAGQTELDGVAIGPGYQASVLATVSTSPAVTGCNVVVRSSFLTGGWAGLRAIGCDLARDGGPMFSGPVLVEVGGPDPADGNVISWMQAPSDIAAGVRSEGCVIRGSFRNNAFVDDTYGIYIDAAAGGTLATQTFTFLHNSFERLTAGGIYAYGEGVRIDELSDNRFAGITRAVTQDPGPRAVAFSADLLRLGKVRRNQFIGNDFGMFLRVQAAVGQAADFGTADDPGGNIFRCNSALRETGADLGLVGGSWSAGANWGGTIHMAGNAWDHAPATVRSDDPSPNGCDISTIRFLNVVLDVQNTSLSTDTCPSDRVPGQ